MPTTYNTIKKTLTTTEEDIYTNFNQGVVSYKVTNIWLCNKTASAATVSLGFAPNGGYYYEGQVLFEVPIAGKGYLELPDRVVNVGESIVAFSDTADAIVLSLDVEGDFPKEEDIIPAP